MTLALKFGVRGFLSGEEHARAEMRTAHHLYNALVAIERWKRAEYATVRSRYVPGLSEVEAAYEQLSDEIGAKAGPAGERGTIREKRQKASVVATETASSPAKKKAKRTKKPPADKGYVVVPTKQVDDEEERDAIAELKAWRRAASEMAKPLRAEFDGMIAAAALAYEARTRGVPIEWLEERDRLRDMDTPEARAALKELLIRIENKSLKTHAKAAANERVRAEMLEEPWHEAWKDVARCEAKAYALRQWVNDAHHLNHGTYVAVFDDVQRAGKRPPPRPDGEPRKPRQRPAFSMKGLRKMGWQIQGAVTWGDVLAGKCGSLRVSEMRPVKDGNDRCERQDRSKTKGQCETEPVKDGKEWRAKIGIRITTAERGVNEWVTCDVALHRPIPLDTKVSWVYLVPNVQRGGKVDYTVQLTVSPTEPLVRRAPGTGHAHISFRWTLRGHTLEVATVNDVPMLLPPQIYAAAVHSDLVCGTADELFNVALAEAVSRGLAIPQWRSPERLYRVAWSLVDPIPDALATWHLWRQQRLAAGRDLVASLEEVTAWCAAQGVAGDPFAHWLAMWRRKDKHLREIQRGEKERSIRRRRDVYRVWAARWSEQFETVSFGGAVDVAALALRDKAEDRPKELHQAARRNRPVAAVAELREAIVYAFGSERVRDAPPPGGARSSSSDAGSVASGAAAE